MFITDIFQYSRYFVLISRSECLDSIVIWTNGIGPNVVKSKINKVFLKILMGAMHSKG